MVTFVMKNTTEAATRLVSVAREAAVLVQISSNQMTAEQILSGPPQGIEHVALLTKLYLPQLLLLCLLRSCAVANPLGQAGAVLSMQAGSQVHLSLLGPALAQVQPAGTAWAMKAMHSLQVWLMPL